MVFEVSPKPFHGIKFGTIGGQKHRYNVGRPAYGFGFVPGAIVEHQDVDRIRKGGGKAIEPHLEGAAVEIRQFKKEVRPSRRFDGAIEIEILELVRDGGHRLDPAGGNPTPDDRQ